MTSKNHSALDIHRHDRCTVIRYGGRFVLEHGAEQLEAVGLEELSLGKRVILDLSAVTQVDARGIGVIARLSARGLAMHMPVVIVEADVRIRRLLDVTQLRPASGAGPIASAASYSECAACG